MLNAREESLFQGPDATAQAVSTNPNQSTIYICNCAAAVWLSVRLSVDSCWRASTIRMLRAWMAVGNSRWDMRVHGWLYRMGRIGALPETAGLAAKANDGFLTCLDYC